MVDLWKNRRSIDKLVVCQILVWVIDLPLSSSKCPPEGETTGCAPRYPEEARTLKWNTLPTRRPMVRVRVMPLLYRRSDKATLTSFSCGSKSHGSPVSGHHPPHKISDSEHIRSVKTSRSMPVRLSILVNFVQLPTVSVEGCH